MSETEQKQGAAPAITMPEAGFAMNVRMLDKHGQEVQLTFRCALVSQGAKLIENYEGTVDGLIARGWEVSKGGVKAASNGGGGGVPNCPTHGTPMKESRKPGTYFCPKKVGEGYCDQKGGTR